MIEHNLKNEPNLEKLLDQAINLFKQTGLIELAEKYNKILKNYKRQKIVR